MKKLLVNFDKEIKTNQKKTHNNNNKNLVLRTSNKYTTECSISSISAIRPLRSLKLNKC